MASSFENRISLVTGGSRGVGRGGLFGPRPQGLGRGADSTAPAPISPRRSPARSRALGRRAMPIALDLADAEAVQAAVARVRDEWGPIDLLVHSAGALAAWSPVRDLPPEEFARYIDVDLTGAFNVIQAVLEVDARARSGSDRRNILDRGANVPGAERPGRRGQGGSRSDDPGRRPRGRTTRHPRQRGLHRAHRHGADRPRRSSAGAPSGPPRSWPVSRWGGSPSRKRSPIWSRSSRASREATSPAR